MLHLPQAMGKVEPVVEVMYLNYSENNSLHIGLK